VRLPGTSLDRLAALTIGLAWLFVIVGSAAAEPANDRADFFEAKVLPILERHCIDCHGEDLAEHKLRLDTTVGILRGGESGEPLLVPGKSAESYLLRRVTSQNEQEVMPRDGERLSDAEVATLRTWIDQGAKMPGADEAAAALRLTTDHWSFQPVQRPALASTGNEIDALVTARLRETGLAMSPQADRETLIRRLYLVMHGLPPTPQEVRDFLADQRDDAYARLVDRVLDSPRYGERWARHWMDVVRYADTNGFETNRERPSAYHYRDYIVKSLNADKPYDQFIQEQLAGDASGIDAATGFLVAGPYDIVKGQDPNLRLMQRQDELADVVNTVSTAFLGLTIGCARCHNHKFDPILQKDYYSMQAVFAGVKHGERPLRRLPGEASEKQLLALKSAAAAAEVALGDLRKKAASSLRKNAGAPNDTHRVEDLRPPVNAKSNEEIFAPTAALSVKFTIFATNSGAPCIDELEVFDEAGTNVALAAHGAKATASGTIAGYEIHKLNHINDGETGNAHSWIASTVANSWVRIDFPAQSRVQRIVWSRDREGRFADRIATQYKIEVVAAPNQWTTVASSDNRQPPAGANKNANKPSNEFLARLSVPDAAAARRLLTELGELKSRIETLSANEQAWVGQFNANPGPTYRLYRGEPLQKREIVPPDALTVLGTLGMDVDEPEQRRRVRFAQWIASPENPLTARVMVNRLWHYIFGNGIVDTPSDFGANGGSPTHPELLDWLADEFVQGGWSIKHMQRLILLSSTFQQSSAPQKDALAIDAAGRYLWRYTPRRLEAEAIRDSMLAVSGALDLQMGGPGFYLLDVQRENVVHYFPKEKYSPAEFRRMVYLFRVRAAQDGVFGAFDCPDGGSVMAKRSRSNTPLQALNLFNSSFTTQQSAIFANRLRAEAGDSAESQVELAFQLCFARPPDEFERDNSTRLIREHGLQSFTRALFNFSEFLFVF
jgi:hypothetical protein